MLWGYKIGCVKTLVINIKTNFQAIEVSSRVFSLAQLYYSDECKSTELSGETNEMTNKISDSKME
jgi:hypothetical protein